MLKRPEDVTEDRSKSKAHVKKLLSESRKGHRLPPERLYSLRIREHTFRTIAVSNKVYPRAGKQAIISKT